MGKPPLDYRPTLPKPRKSRYHRSRPKRGRSEKSRAKLDLKRAGELTRSAIKSALREIPRQKSIDLDPWQEEACQALVTGCSVVVDAPTTAGKTRVVETYFATHIDEPGFRAAYTTPVKSLSNDKVKEFRQRFGHDKVGIATGDIKENLDAPIVVATLESYRNSLLGVEPDLGRALVVFDEYHFLQDVSRGSAWEEAIILTPHRCQILLLSASVANAVEFCDWLRRLNPKRQALLVKTNERPVPLCDLVYVHDNWYLADSLPNKIWHLMDKDRLRIPLPFSDLVPRLLLASELNLNPVIVYSGRRATCEQLAAALGRMLKPLDQDRRRKIRESLAISDSEVGSNRFLNRSLINSLIHFGVGYHHSGLAAPARIAIEALVKQGLLRYCVATMGLSLGINFSVRSALISDYSRPDASGPSAYAASEVLQMLGRAGRRGKDRVGFSLWPTVESFRRFGAAQRETIYSKLRTDPSTFLGLIGRGFGLRAIEEFYKKSFMRQQNRQADMRIITKALLTKHFDPEEIPCHSPAAAYVRFWSDELRSETCDRCKIRKKCHPIIDRMLQSPLATLHLHMHEIGTLDDDERLTAFGSLARYFPQNGGLLIAHRLAYGKFSEEDIESVAEFAAGFALARHKEPRVPKNYRWPFDEDMIEEELEWYYPIELFPEMYDMSNRRHPDQIREYNPKAGFIIRSWIAGTDWPELSSEVVGDYFGTGDLMSLIYRVATYLQSITQTPATIGPDSSLQSASRGLRQRLLREPLDFILSI